jgi:hypothetical protein
MRMLFTRQSVLLVLLLAGCMKPNPLIYTLGEDATDSESSDEDSGDGDPGDGDSGQTMMDMPELQCGESLEPVEVDCGECLSLDCCEFALACAEVDQCLCLADCMLGGGSPGACKNTCGGVLASDVDELQPVLDCAALHCEQAC